jgi:hypothetical protein
MRTSLEAGEQNSSIIGTGVFRNRSAGPLRAASSEPQKRSLISLLPLARCWPECPENYHPVEAFRGSKRAAGCLFFGKMVKTINQTGNR